MGRTKRQARLAFNPLPTSSPSSSAAVKENGQRSYANVGYEGSQHQSKRRRVMNESTDGAHDDDGKISLLHLNMRATSQRHKASI